MRAQEPVLLESPTPVVPFYELADRLADLRNRAEGSAVNGLLLEGAEKPLGDPVGLDSGGRHFAAGASS